MLLPRIFVWVRAGSFDRQIVRRFGGVISGVRFVTVFCRAVHLLRSVLFLAEFTRFLEACSGCDLGLVPDLSAGTKECFVTQGRVGVDRGCFEAVPK